MIYKAVTVWLAFQLPLGLLVGSMLRRAEMPEIAGQEDGSDMPLPVLSELRSGISVST